MRLDLAWVKNVEDHHRQEHKKGVETIHKDLVADQVSVVSLNILHSAENGPDQDQEAGTVKSI